MDEVVFPNCGRCQSCHEIVPNDKTREHILNCRLSEKKSCPICQLKLPIEQFEKHLQICDQHNNDEENASGYVTPPSEIFKQNSKKKCPFCPDMFDENLFEDHIETCSNTCSANETMKKCICCDQLINPADFENHTQLCSTKSSKISFQIKKTCPICCESFDESVYFEHMQCCSNSAIEHQSSERKDRECFICGNWIDEINYESHVHSCLAKLDEQPNETFNCFSCGCSIDRIDGNFHEISCTMKHKYCLKCLRDSMNEFARQRSIPVCHRDRCDYELSRHEISLIPLQRSISDRLMRLAKGEQRPFCPKCRFYVNVNEFQTFDEHAEMCGEDFIPCEFCQMPYSVIQLETHSVQCRSDQSSSLQEKFICFLLPRMKYPFTKEQIRLYLDKKYSNQRNRIDPHEIIDALSEYGSNFPYDIPKRECGICLESRPYDDIYVFDCDESHKICYDCYFQCCQTKMNNGEMLTCALCSHPLRDGELNQLRISDEQLKIIRNYQMKKTFDIYSSRTRGIIKCPNQECSWVAEAEDPNERFQVQCPRCHRQFCSLCNEQYHYRTTCQQLPQITQRWFFWCETERQRYLTMRAQQDQQYAQQLQDYQRQNDENNHRNQDLRRRYDELMNDEKYKAENCRLCPSCKRVVQRLEGCDSMICGQDAHGGNVQSGCGHKFNWTQAQPYTAATTQQPRETILNLPKPESPVVHHTGVKCDHCQNDLNGIRFDCVHCPALTFCEKCEQQATLQHSEENQLMQQKQHVFKLIMTQDEEATNF